MRNSLCCTKTYIIFEGGLRFAETLVELGGKVCVPTTLNANSVDRRRWRDLGVAETLGVPAYAVGTAYLEMGATHSFTCAPYLLETGIIIKKNQLIPLAFS